MEVPFLYDSRYLWSSCDAEADVLYVNFKKPSHANASELTDDDVVIRYAQGQVRGLTILNASRLVRGSTDTLHEAII